MADQHQAKRIKIHHDEIKQMIYLSHTNPTSNPLKRKFEGGHADRPTIKSDPATDFSERDIAIITEQVFHHLAKYPARDIVLDTLRRNNGDIIDSIMDLI
jgi:hypothetical protein